MRHGGHVGSTSTRYLNKLLANDAINDSLAKNFHNIERFLSHPACEIVPQIQFDFNLEVSNGFCFSISKRAFVPNPINESMSGKLSPRAYVPYDCSSQPQPKYFRRAIHNSFPEEQVRLNFLNKFYQCFLAYKIPQKTRKLVVTGPRDSGKTSWASIFRRIIPEEYIASITNERHIYIYIYCSVSPLFPRCAFRAIFPLSVISLVVKLRSGGGDVHCCFLVVKFRFKSTPFFTSTHK